MTNAVTRVPGRGTGLVLTAGIAELALTTGYIHLSLGGVLFTLNALGYLGLAVLVVVSELPHPMIRRFRWLPRLGLAGFTAVTIGAYLVVGPYFTLGWVAKAVEVAILTLLAAEVIVSYGSVAAFTRAVLSSLRGRRLGRAA